MTATHYSANSRRRAVVETHRDGVDCNAPALWLYSEDGARTSTLRRRQRLHQHLLQTLTDVTGGRRHCSRLCDIAMVMVIVTGQSTSKSFDHAAVVS